LGYREVSRTSAACFKKTGSSGNIPELLRNTKQSTAAIHGITSRIGDILDRREMAQSCKPVSVTIIDNLCTAVKQKQYLMNSTMSPESKAAVAATITAFKL
jgi:hypothetical protein